MKRLAELEGIEGDEQALADLVRGAALERQAMPQDPFRKPRVRARLLRQEASRSRRLTPSLLVAAVAVSAASAAAHWGAKLAPADSAVVVPAPSAASATPARGQQRPMRATTQPEPAPPSPTPSAEPARAGLVPRRETARAVASREPEDPTRVVEAMRALRQEKNPKRAQALLAEHLAQHPRSALSEEVLALSIEAAVARGDARAQDFARRYLKQYPRGRFRELALRTLAKKAK